MTLVRDILNRPSRRGTRRTGFSLLETTVAISVLGIGLIMVSAMFPIALTQHRISVDRDRAHNTAVAAESLLRNTIDDDQLWPTGLLHSRSDTGWYLIPSPNLQLGSNNTSANARNWDYMTQGPDNDFYANLISGFPSTYGNRYPSNTLHVMDTLNDDVAPFTTNNPDSPYMDSEFLDIDQNMVWCGFYRRLATGGVEYAVAVCKQRRNQIFAEQDFTDTWENFNQAVLFPTAVSATPPRAWRLPIPWRIRVTCRPGTNIIWKASAGEPLAKLAPVGTKLMVQGETWTDCSYVGVPPRPVPAGKILTVSDVINSNSVEVLSDLSEFPAHTGADPTLDIWFDIWVFPPAVEGNDFDNRSPLIEWKLHL